MNNIPISIASMGLADHGKSTLFGKIAFDCQPSEFRTAWENEVAGWEIEPWYREDRFYTYLFDRLSIERKGRGENLRGMGNSVVSTHVQCKIEQKQYLLIDAPGHNRYINNATNGIFQATSGVLVIQAIDTPIIIKLLKNAYTGGFEKQNFWRQKDIMGRKGDLINIFLYLVLARTYGFQNLFVAISKMDEVDFDPTIFLNASNTLNKYLHKWVDLTPNRLAILPASVDVTARSDVNVVTPIEKGHKMAWYKGKTLLQTLSQIQPKNPRNGELLLPIETLYWKQKHHHNVIVTGRILQGKVSVNDKVKVLPLYGHQAHFDQPNRLLARIRDIRLRNISAQLPWSGKLDNTTNKENASTYNAGNVVGISLKIDRKESKNNIAHYFKKGVIVTGKDALVVYGNIIKADIFIPEMCRNLIVGQQWQIFLYGKSKGDAILLDLEDVCESPTSQHSGIDKWSNVFVTLLLAFPMAYLESKDNSFLYRDIVLRESNTHSFCGGRVTKIYFANRMISNFQFTQQTSETKRTSQLNKFMSKWSQHILEADTKSIEQYNARFVFKTKGMNSDELKRLCKDHFRVVQHRSEIKFYFPD